MFEISLVKGNNIITVNNFGENRVFMAFVKLVMTEILVGLHFHNCVLLKSIKMHIEKGSEEDCFL